MKQIMNKPFQNEQSIESPHIDESRGLRVLRLLEHLALASQPITQSQLAARLQVPKATMMRTLDDLERHGYVLRAPAGRGYVPGAASTHLALVTLRNNALIRLCRGALAKLVAVIGETCNLAILDGNSVMYVDRVETTEPLRLNLASGTRAPIHCTASGKLFLSRLSLFEQRRLLSSMCLEKLTPGTITDPILLEQALKRIANSGIGVDDEEFVHGMVAIAVPICSVDGEVIAAVACHAPVARKSLSELMSYVPRLHEAGLLLLPALVDTQAMPYAARL